MYYLDSNVFVSAAIDEGQLGEAAADLIGKAAKGELRCAASVLALDEAAWVFCKEKDRAFAADVIKNYLELSIPYFEVTRDIMLSAIELMQEHSLDPRDSIHLATMASRGIVKVISDDPDFDLAGIARTPVRDAAKL